MNILLTGATGFIGYSLLRALLQQGHHVTACCRHPQRLLVNTPTLAIDFAQLHTAAQWLPYLQQMDVVINCVGIINETKQQTFTQLHHTAPAALFTAAAQMGVKKVIQISALGADAQAESAYHLSKKAADDVLRSLPIEGCILQPSIVYGDGAQSSALFHALAALPVHFLPDGGRQLVQPIYIADLVAVVKQCLDAHTPSQHTVALVGAEAISYAELLQQLRRRLGKPPALTVSLPYRYVLASACFGQYVGEPMLSKDNIAMLNRGNTADTQAITALLMRPPVSMRQQLFSQPATQAERWHAQLYFLQAVLCFVIAFVWLWSGFTSLFFYSHQLSYQLLAATGITGDGAPLMLYGLALMDIGLGLATLARYHTVALLSWQIIIVVFYSVVVAFTLPEFLIHPFGALLKNLPFLVTLLIYQRLAGERPCYF